LINILGCCCFGLFFVFCWWHKRRPPPVKLRILGPTIGLNMCLFVYYVARTATQHAFPLVGRFFLFAHAANTYAPPKYWDHPCIRDSQDIFIAEEWNRLCPTKLCEDTETDTFFVMLLIISLVNLSRKGYFVTSSESGCFWFVCLFTRTVIMQRTPWKLNVLMNGAQ